ncbi:opioid growth factor receptor-like protein 1 [Hyperolius riggenbachi]|uniref:opioid growth factor receptor-like protein 1 n=1 Tax=Hyperolius riggenbachi TaxID=752182 RepID=UPI0035A28C21
MSRDTEEEWSGQYDSTWEEEDGEEPRGKKEPEARRQYKVPGRWWNRAARDLQNYRHGYEQDSNYQQYSCRSEHTPNLDFYQNKKRFEPSGVYIDDVLKDWKDDYVMLERNHCYIQWLFPLRECGMNSYAKPLTRKEIQMMKREEQVQRRFLAAYNLMLGFYGIELVDEETGRVTRAAEWEDRFKNLNYHSHNNLRITRILKCLGELGYERFQAPLVRFFLEETLCHGRLHNVRRSALDYFMFTVKDKNERKKLVHFAWENYKPQEKFIWGPVEKLRKYKPPPENKQEAKVCHSEKKEESNDDTKPNGYVNSPQDDDDDEDIKDNQKYRKKRILDYAPITLRPEKNSNQESIPLSERLEDKGKLLSEDSNTCCKAMSENTDLPSNNAGDSVSGMQMPTEDKMKKLDGGGEAPHEGSSDHDHVVTSTERHQENHKADGVDDENLEKNIQQDNSPTDISKTPTGTPRKRKRITNSSESDLPGRTEIPRQPDKGSGLNEEERERCGHSEGDDKVKKPKPDALQDTENSENQNDQEKPPVNPENSTATPPQ